MLDLGKFRESGERNDIIIQRALIDIDAEPLATALVGLDDGLREIVFRNMSKRAVVSIKDDIREREGAAPSAVEAARALFQRLLEKHEADYESRRA